MVSGLPMVTEGFPFVSRRVLASPDSTKKRPQCTGKCEGTPRPVPCITQRSTRVASDAVASADLLPSVHAHVEALMQGNGAPVVAANRVDGVLHVDACAGARRG